MSEYEKLDIERLHEITQQYRPDGLRDQATGWVNAQTMLKTLREALEGHLKTIEGKWTSAAAKPYLAEINKTLHQIERSEERAGHAADGLETMAGAASMAQRDVEEAYKKWKEEQGQAQSDYESEQEEYENDPSGYLMFWTQGPQKPDQDALREKYSKVARGHMDGALEQHQSVTAHVSQAIAPYKPVEVGAPDLPGEEPGWGNDGASGSHATDSAGLAATSYGGNAAGSSPALQSGGPAPVTPSPGGGGAPAGTPAPGMGGAPVGGVPVGGVPGAGRTPTPPARPLSPGANPGARPASGSAPRTPGLPNNRGSATGTRPNGVPGSRTNQAGRPGATPGNGRGAGAKGRPGTGRGLQKSRYAPQDRTGRVRASGEVMGRRASTAKQEAEKSRGQQSPRNRRIQPSVIRGAKTSGAKTAPSRSGPADRTGQGYTRQVIGGRQRTQFSRTPVVGRRLDTTAGQNILGKQTPQTEEDKAKQLMNERRNRRRAMNQPDEGGLSRPVIDNGISHAAQLDEAKPLSAEPVKAEDSFWQLDDQQVTRGVIGQPRPTPEANHDPGPGVITSRGGDIAPEEEPGADDPGPTAFGRQRPDTTNWP